MEDNNSGHQKPIRPHSNKRNDFQNIYGKSAGGNVNADTNQDKHHKDSNDEIRIPIQDSSSNDKDIALENQIEEFRTKLDNINQQVESLQKERDELKDQLVRKAAEFENFRRRTIEEKKEIVEFSNVKLLSSMIEILEDINSAYEASKNTSDVDSMNKGVELIYQKTNKIFEDAGVKRMEIKPGDEFDVNEQEALMATKSEFPVNTVVQVIQNGYFFKDKVLRYAKVITSNGN